MNQIRVCEACRSKIPMEAKICPNCGHKKNSASPLRTWGTIVIMVMVVALVLYKVQNKNEEYRGFSLPIEAVSFSTTQSISKIEGVNSIKGGTYEIGKGVQAGEYIVINSDNSYPGFFELRKTNSDKFEDIIGNGTVYNYSIITVSDGQVLEISNVDMYPFNSVTFSKPTDGIYKAGMYKVGVNIKAGSYKIIPADINSNYRILKDSTHNQDSILETDYIDGATYINLKDNQYIIIEDAVISNNL